MVIVGIMVTFMNFMIETLRFHPKNDKTIRIAKCQSFLITAHFGKGSWGEERGEGQALPSFIISDYRDFYIKVLFLTAFAPSLGGIYGLFIT
jgi:hypothetical protein